MDLCSNCRVLQKAEGMKVNWNDVERILFDGTEEQINSVRCPECGGELRYTYFPKTRSTEIRCMGCYTVSRGSGASKTPNFALLNAESA